MSSVLFSLKYDKSKNTVRLTICVLNDHFPHFLIWKYPGKFPVKSLHFGS